MMITTQSLAALNQGFNAAFMQGFGVVEPSYTQIAMVVPSSSDAENYGWMKDLPGMREWVGARVVNNLEATSAQLKNKTYEHTIGVSKNDIEDDKLGIYKPMFAQQGEVVARHPDDLVWGLLPAGFSTKGFDGQNFFDADHEGFDRQGKSKSWSNVQPGSGPAWFVMDLSRAFLKPLIFQVRKEPQFVAKTRADDHSVFMEGVYHFGAEARYVAGFGFHQLAFGSKDGLTPENYEKARLALSTQFRPDGSPLGIGATHLVCGPSMETKARTLLEKERLANGEDNIWNKTAKVIVSPWLE